MDICWVTSSDNSGVAEQSRVIAPGIDATVVMEEPLDVPRGRPYILDDNDVVHPTENLSDTLLHLDPDIVVFHAITESTRDALARLSPHMITVARLGINIKEQMMAGPKYIRELPDVLDFLNTVDHIICSSQRPYDEMRTHGISEDRLSVIHSAVDTDDVTEPTRSCSNSIGMIGRIGRIKNQFTAIQGACGLRAFGVSPEVHLAGDSNGALLPNLRGIVMQMSPAFDLRYHGYVDDPVDEFFSMLDVHCHPSWTENCPQTLLESAVAGVPSIVSELSWADSYGRDVFPTCRPDNPWDWSKELNEMLQDAEYRYETARRQQAELLSQYSTDEIVPKYDELFEELLDEHGSFKVSSEVVA